MAAARAPNPADARIPCPMCGGLIHPIAGRCKHCKHDLTTVRGARPAAVASLPSLIAQQAQQTPRAHAPGMNGVNGSNGHAPAAYVDMRPMQQIVPAATVVDANPILPPRPTGRMQASASQRSSWWKSWPLIVIVLAGIAIVVAVVLMVWPPGTKNAGAPSQGRLAPAPAPERMETNPLPPPSAKTPPTPQPNDPWAPKGTDPVPPPDDPAVDPDDSLKDPFSGGGSGGTFGSLNGTGAVLMSMMRHACDRATTCGFSDDKIKQYCQMVKDMPPTPPPASCADAAKKCFEHIDQMSCAFDALGDVTAVAYKFKDCVEAVSC